MSITAQSDSRRQQSAPIRILIVEDLEVEAELARRQLEASGIVHVMRRVETEAAMRAALESFAPTIILSD
ncbi:MAG: hypothetical protein ACREU3_19855, partial [Steroidobacteraceae bacterium]